MQASVLLLSGPQLVAISNIRHHTHVSRDWISTRAAQLIGCLLQAELEAAKKFLYQEMGYRSRSEQLTKTSEINLDYQEVIR